MLLRSFPVGLLVALFLPGEVARAGEPQQDDASRAAAAQSLFEEAVKLMEAGKYGEACPKLAASEKLDPGAGTLLNLGTCYEKNAQIASAWATFIEAEAVATRAGHPDWALRAHEHSAKLSPHLPRLAIVVSQPAPQTLKITRDGVPLDEGAWGTAMPVDAGPHTVSASAPGKKGWSAPVELRADAPPVTVTVPTLEDEPPPPAPPPAVVTPTPPVPAPHEEPPHPPPPPPVFWNGRRVTGAGVGGVGVAALAAGVALVVAAKSKYDDASGRCPGSVCKSQSDVDEGTNAHQLANAATGVLIAGGVFAALGGGLILIQDGTPWAGWRLSPNLGPHVAGASFEGAW
jgi:hypothetical protein